MPEKRDLVDQKLIDYANTKLTSAADRLKKATDDLAAAQSAHAKAKETAARAPSLDNETALEGVERAARVAEKAHTAATTAHGAVSSWVPLARGVAHSELFLAGLRGRVAAAEKADNARALMAEAEADMHAAVATCHQAIASGHPDIRSLNSRPIAVAFTAAEERAAIQAEGIDLATGHYAWLDYAKTQEPEA